MTKEERSVSNAAYYLRRKAGIASRIPLTKEERKAYMKEYSAAYYLSHRGPLTRQKPSAEKVRAMHREWNKAHRDVIRKAGDKWTKNNPGKANAKTMLRYARKLKATPVWITDKDKSEILRFYITASEKGLEVDHVIPLRGKSVSGLHVPWNLQLLTKHENSTKGNHYGLD